MAGNTRAEFEIGLKDDTRSGVDSSVAGLKRAEATLKNLTKEYDSTQKAMRNLQKGAVVDVDTYRKLSDKQKTLGERIASSQSSILKQRDALGRHVSAGNDAAKSVDKFGATLRAASGPINSIGTSIHESVGKFGAFGAGVLAVSIGLAALAVGAVRAAKSLATLALSSADARRSELLHFEAITKIRNVWGIMGGSAKVMQDAVDSVADKTSLSREELSRYADQLQKTGFRGNNLKLALEGMAITAQTQGDTYAQAFAGMASTNVFFGGSVKRMTDDVKARLGGIAAKQLLSLPNILAKLKYNITQLFRDVKIEGFLAAFKKFTDMLSLNTATGAALRQILSTVFSAFFGNAAKAGPTMQTFVEGAVLGLQDIIIAALQAGLWIKRTFKIGGEHKKFLDWMLLGKVAVLGLVSGLILLAAVLGTIAFSLAFITAGLMLLLVAVAAPFVLLYEMIKGVKDAWDEAAGSWSQFGKNLAKGIADGIVNGTKWVIDAISNLAGSAKAKFKAVFGIASPSKWAMRESRWIPAGAAVGIRAGIPQVHAAIADMRGASIGAGFGAGGGAIASVGRAGAPSVVVNLTVNAASGEARDIEAAVERAVESALERTLLQMGAS